MTDPRMTPTNDAPVTVERQIAIKLREAFQGAVFINDYRENGHAQQEMVDACEGVDDLARDLAALASAPAGDGVAEEAARAYFERGFMACYAWQYVNKAAQLSDAVIDHAWDNREEGGELPALDRPRAAVGERAEYADRIVVAWESSPHQFPVTKPHQLQMALIAADAILALQSPPAKVEG